MLIVQIMGNVYKVGWSRILYTQEDIKKVESFMNNKKLVMNKYSLLHIFNQCCFCLYWTRHEWRSYSCNNWFFVAIFLGLWEFYIIQLKEH